MCGACREGHSLCLIGRDAYRSVHDMPSYNSAVRICAQILVAADGGHDGV